MECVFVSKDRHILNNREYERLLFCHYHLEFCEEVVSLLRVDLGFLESEDFVDSLFPVGQPVVLFGNVIIFAISGRVVPVVKISVDTVDVCFKTGVRTSGETDDYPLISSTE